MSNGVTKYINHEPDDIWKILMDAIGGSSTSYRNVAKILNMNPKDKAMSMIAHTSF